MSRTARFNKLITGFLAVVVMVLGVGSWQYADHHNNQPATKAAKTVQTAPEPTNNLKYQGEAGQTALMLLHQHATIETKNSSLGEYVTAINGNDGGGTKYWLFYVDGQQSNVGADQYVTQQGQTIEWRLE